MHLTLENVSGEERRATSLVSGIVGGAERKETEKEEANEAAEEAEKTEESNEKETEEMVRARLVLILMCNLQ